jgi:hypothetical protein
MATATTAPAHTHSHDAGISHSHSHDDDAFGGHGHSHEILDGPGSYLNREMPLWNHDGRDWKDRAFTIGIGGYVCLSFCSRFPLAVLSWIGLACLVVYWSGTYTCTCMYMYCKEQGTRSRQGTWMYDYEKDGLAYTFLCVLQTSWIRQDGAHAQVMSCSER